MEHTPNLHAMESIAINQLAVKLLCNLLNHSSVNLVAKLTGISRTTLYRWLDESVDYGQMNPRDAAWFILVYETKPQVQLLLDRAPSRPHLAHRLLEES